jgi:hypothetical protein
MNMGIDRDRNIGTEMNVDTDIDKDVKEKYLIPDIGLLQYQVIPI